MTLKFDMFNAGFIAFAVQNNLLADNANDFRPRSYGYIFGKVLHFLARVLQN